MNGTYMVEHVAKSWSLVSLFLPKDSTIVMGTSCNTLSFGLFFVHQFRSSPNREALSFKVLSKDDDLLPLFARIAPLDRFSLLVTVFRSLLSLPILKLLAMLRLEELLRRKLSPEWLTSDMPLSLEAADKDDCVSESSPIRAVSVVQSSLLLQISVLLGTLGSPVANNDAFVDGRLPSPQSAFFRMSPRQTFGESVRTGILRSIVSLLADRLKVLLLIVPV